jgi:hypothetical protein
MELKEMFESLRKEITTIGRDKFLGKGEELAPTCPNCGKKIWAGDHISKQELFTIHASCIKINRA